MERLQKVMAKAGLGSRRHCETLISSGRVRVNGRLATLGQKVDPQNDLVEVDEQVISFEAPCYIMLNKPKGVLSSTEDELQQSRPTVRDLVDIPGHLYPVGRLDKQSEGLILLTNDGQLTYRLTHPRFGHSKVYYVEVEGSIAEEELERWRKGLPLDGRRTAPAKITVIDRTTQNTALHITLKEGRKRQIRRIAASLGHPVTRLIRIQMGPTKLGELGPGKWRHLTAQEIHDLRKSVGIRT